MGTKRFVLALATPLLLGVYAAQPIAFGLALVAYVPWLLLYTDDRNPPASWGWYLLGAFAAQLAIYPQFFKFGWYFPPLRALIYLVPWLLFLPLIRGIHRGFRLPRALSFPLVWVAVEYVRIRFSLSNFDIYGLGYALAPVPPLVQSADLAGFYGITFIVAAINGWWADALAARREAGGFWRAVRTPRIAWSALAVALLFLGNAGYGLWRLADTRLTEGPRVAVLQPNLKHNASNAVGVHLEQVLMTNEWIEPGTADLILWPENAVLDNLERKGTYLDDLAWLAERKRAPLLVGAMGKPADRPGRTTNTAFLIREDGSIGGRYHKQLLFPWSEYVPLDDSLGRWAPSLQYLQRRLIRLGWGFMPTGVPGDETTLISFEWQGGSLLVGPLICLENVDPRIPAEAKRLGARLFLNLTSEGEVGGSVQEQLLRVSMLRAIENRTAYVRAGNSGISAFIDPLGRLHHVLKGRNGGVIFDAGAALATTRLGGDRPTAYAASHDLFAKSCLAVSLALASWGALRGRRARATAVTLALLLFAGGCSGTPALRDTDPARAAAELARGRERVEAGKQRAALASFAAACGDPATCGAALDPIRRLFLARRTPEAGVGFFAAVAERYPDLAGQALAMRGQLREQALDLVGAEADLREAVERWPTAESYRLLGRLLMRLDRPADAAQAFRDGLRTSPREVELLYQLGRTLRILERYDEARGQLETAVALDPEHAGAWTNLARVRLEQGEREAAEALFERALKTDARNLESRFQLAKLALRDGRDERARQLVSEIQAVEQSFARGFRERE